MKNSEKNELLFLVFQKHKELQFQYLDFYIRIVMKKQNPHYRFSLRNIEVEDNLLTLSKTSIKNKIKQYCDTLFTS